MMQLPKEFDELKKKITPESTIKFIAGTLVSLGATAATIGIFGLPLRNSKGITKLLMKLGIFFLGCKAGDVAKDCFKETYDDTKAALEEGKRELLTDGKDEKNG